MITDFVPSLSLENFIAQRDAMVERAQQARRALQEIHDIAEALPRPTTYHGSWYRLGLLTEPERFDFIGDRGFDNYVKGIDAGCWARLLDLSGLRTFMDATARAAWDANIDQRNVPPLTIENVEATFQVMHASRREMFERGVIAVFKSLSWDYKRHNPIMFGKRIILRHVYDPRFSLRSRAAVNYTGASQVDDLMRPLRILDGKPELDHRQGAYQRLRAAAERDPAEPVVDFDGYFTLRGFKNGNAHLTFTRPDLVDKMNQIIGRHFPGALPPSKEPAAP